MICFQILSLTTFLQDVQGHAKFRFVVICFQILSLTTFLQTSLRKKQIQPRCDLLSNFIFDNVLTRKQFNYHWSLQLWFAFKFYLWQRSYKPEFLQHEQKSVVICFQILSLTTFLQASLLYLIWLQRCDLLSNFIFDNVLTSWPVNGLRSYSLWFAFKFYLWQRSYKKKHSIPTLSWLWFAFKFYLWQRSYKAKLVGRYR